MGLFELLALAVGLSMDAFAVACCKGLALGRFSFKNALCVGAWFGAFQALMPAVGYFVGTAFISYIAAYDHWVAFILLVLIGGNMVRESFSRETDETDASLRPRAMVVLAIATSVDALASGVTLLELSVPQMLGSVALIGVVTLVLSGVGVWMGGLFGVRYKNKAELAGGIILILLGVKILLEHFGVLPF